MSTTIDASRSTLHHQRFIQGRRLFHVVTSAEATSAEFAARHTTNSDHRHVAPTHQVVHWARHNSHDNRPSCNRQCRQHNVCHVHQQHQVVLFLAETVVVIMLLELVLQGARIAITVESPLILRFAVVRVSGANSNEGTNALGKA